ncbi:MAG: phosphoserine phosphatase SerB [Geminicoccaceae bacterium]
MSAVACLIADPEREPLDRKLVDETARLLRGAAPWLADDEAAEIFAPHLQPADAAAPLSNLVHGLLLDHAVLPAANRRKRLLLCDMDSTIIEIECIDELADFAGIKPQIAEVTRRAMNGEIVFEEALRARVELLAGLPETVVERVITERLRLTRGAKALVATMRAHGARTALVSGGFMPFTRRVQELCGFDDQEANELAITEGRIIGKIAGRVFGPTGKLDTLRRLRVELGLDASATLAVGDGANDLPMIEAAGLGVAFHPHARLRDHADACIDHGDLTAVLFLQGYRRDEFVIG